MKKKFRYLMMAGLLAMTASCNKYTAEECPECEQEGPVAVLNDQLVLIASKKGDLLSENTWRDKETIGLYLTRGTLDRFYEADSVAYSNIKAVMKAGLWELSPEIVRLTSSQAVVFAYSPYRRIVSPYAVPVETESGTEYMYGSHLSPQRYVAKGDNVASIEMCNALSMIEVNVRKGEDFDARALLTSVAIVPAADSITMATEGTLNIENGEITPTAWGEYRRSKLDMELDYSFTKENRVRLLTIPRELRDGELLLQIQVAGYTFHAPLRDEHDWLQGVRNVYNVTFTGETLHIDGVEIKPWVDIRIDGELVEGKDNDNQYNSND